MANTRQHIFIVAGEASGDLHGAHLVRALKQQYSQLEIGGVGGSYLNAEGVTLLSNSDELAVVGVLEVVKKLKTVWRVYKQLSRYLSEHRPAVLILIDYPEFNLRLARVAHRLGIPVVYYISPQVWAWRSNRVKLIRRLVTKMIVIFPFEQAFYKSHGVDVEWVGHPLVESVKPSQSKVAFCQQHELDSTQPIIGLLPGSRESEAERLLPVMLAAAQRIRAQKPDVQFVLPLAASLEQSALFQASLPSFVRLVRQQTYDAIHAADFVVTASGTVTVETAILETPMIITYIVSPLTYWLGRLFITVPFIGMVNLIANKQIAKELIQTQVTPEAIAQEVFTFLQHPEQLEHLRLELRKIHQKLGKPGAAERAAAVILDILKKYDNDLS